MTAKFRELANALKDESPRFDRSSMASMAPLAFLLGSAKANIQPRSPDNVSQSVLNDQINDVIFADKTAVIDFRRELRNCVINIYNPKKVIFGEDVASTTKSEKRETELEEKRQGRGLLGFLKKKRNLPGMAGIGKTFKDGDADPGFLGGLFNLFRNLSATQLGTGFLGLLGIGEGARRFGLLGRAKDLFGSVKNRFLTFPVRRFLSTQSGSFVPRSSGPLDQRTLRGAADDLVKKKTAQTFGRGAASRFLGRVGGAGARFLLHPALLPATLGVEALNLLYVQPLLNEVKRLSDEYYEGQIEYSNMIRAGQFRAQFNGQHPSTYHETTAKILEELQRSITVRLDEIQTQIDGHFSGKPELQLDNETLKSLYIEKKQLSKIEPPLSYRLEFPETSSTMKLNVPVRMNAEKAPDYSDIIFLHKKLAEMKLEQKTLTIGGTEMFAPAEGMPQIVGYEMHSRIVPDDGRLFAGEQQVERRPIFDFQEGARSAGPQAMTKQVGEFGGRPIIIPTKGNADDNIIRTHEVIERERLTPDQQKTNEPDPNISNIFDGYDPFNLNNNNGFSPTN